MKNNKSNADKDTANLEKDEAAAADLEAAADDAFAEGFVESDPVKSNKSDGKDSSSSSVDDIKAASGNAVATEQDSKDGKQSKSRRNLTETEIDTLIEAARGSVEQAKQISKAFGTIGELQQQLKSLRNGTNQPVAIDNTKKKDESLRELSQDEIIDRRLQKMAMDELTEDYPDWRTIVGASDKPDPNHPFRKWLSAQSQEYQDKINASNSARTISRAIELFKKQTAIPVVSKPNGRSPAAVAKAHQARALGTVKANAARTDRIKNAVPPKTTGGLPSRTAKTADDEFREGFASG